MSKGFVMRQIGQMLGVTDGTREAVEPTRQGFQCAAVGHPCKCTGAKVYLLGEMRFDRPRLILLPHKCDACGSVKQTYWSLTTQVVRVEEGVPQREVLPEALQLRVIIGESTLPSSRQALEVIGELERSIAA